jgi:hypothetical protein
MILKYNQVCPYFDNCIYHGKHGGFCQGTNPRRDSIFECDYVNEKGEFIKEGHIRSIHDITGKMEFIQE